MIKLTVKALINLQSDIVKQSGGIKGVKDKNLLHSCIDGAFTSFGGVDLYPTLLDKLAFTSYSIIRNHVMSDGNKRTGCMALIIGLSLNNYSVSLISSNSLNKVALEIACGKMTLEQFTSWIKNHTKKLGAVNKQHK